MRYLIVFSFIFFSTLVRSQELNINVDISAPRLNLVDPKVFETMESQISDFINKTKWTDDEFEEFEKIEGNINITITAELSATSFAADIYVQSIRPVFNSNYKTQVINFLDKVTFTYREFQPIQNSYNAFYDPLSSLLTFYVYLIIGSDYDTYSLLGGDPYFETAQNIVNSIPTSNQSLVGEWGSQGDTRNKYWIMENIRNARIRPIRQALYDYNINGLDKMHEDAARSRAVMVSALTTAKDVHRSYPNSAFMQMFVNAKREEIIEIFKGAGRGEQSKVYDIMVKLDPSQASRYSGIK